MCFKLMSGLSLFGNLVVPLLLNLELYIIDVSMSST